MIGYNLFTQKQKYNHLHDFGKQSCSKCFKPSWFLTLFQVDGNTCNLLCPDCTKKKLRIEALIEGFEKIEREREQ